MVFPWLLCPIFTCSLWINGTVSEYTKSYPPKLGMFGGSYHVFVNRPCVDIIPIEKVEISIRYKEEEK